MNPRTEKLRCYVATREVDAILRDDEKGRTKHRAIANAHQLLLKVCEALAEPAQGVPNLGVLLGVIEVGVIISPASPTGDV
jgi:hypothetical protein